MSGTSSGWLVALMLTLSVPGIVKEEVEAETVEAETVVEPVEETAAEEVVRSVQSTRPLIAPNRMIMVNGEPRMGMDLGEEPTSSSLDSYPIGNHPMGPRLQPSYQVFARLPVLPNVLFAAWNWWTTPQ